MASSTTSFSASSNATPSSSKLPSITGPPPGWKPKSREIVNDEEITPLPPGMILDENGKPCKICNSWQVWSKAGGLKSGGKAAKSRGAGQGRKSGSSAASGGMAGMLGAIAAGGVTDSTPESTEEIEDPARPSHCPPDVNSLGRSTWTFLHTTAAHYPISAPPATQSTMLSLLNSLSILYPCTHCATDFREKIREFKPDVSGRAGLSKWLCERHNEVNERLGKEAFDCAEKKLRERWRDGPEDRSCD